MWKSNYITSSMMMSLAMAVDMRTLNESILAQVTDCNAEVSIGNGATVRYEGNEEMAPENVPVTSVQDSLA